MTSVLLAETTIVHANAVYSKHRSKERRPHIVDENVIGMWGILFAAILGLADVNAGDAGAEDR